MTAPSRTDVTILLKKASDGDDLAVNRLMPLVYDELRALAESCLQRERPDHTLQATALVNEAYLRLIRQEDVEWQSRAHFFAVAAQAIRRILVDHARTHQRAKRGGGRQRVRLDEDLAIRKERDIDLVALDEAMERLARLNERQARIVELRFFGGLGLKEVAECLGVSPRTVDGDWSMARAWLRRELHEGAES
ncbi:MAG: sigma-70 family RNA polymerase sigma factor [Planctomycetota bacterium]